MLAQYIILALVFNKGKPHRSPLFTNYALLGVLLAQVRKGGGDLCTYWPRCWGGGRGGAAGGGLCTPCGAECSPKAEMHASWL